MDLSQTFYKVTDKDEKHYDFQYVDGLNELDESKEKFNDDPQASCCKGGLYFTTFENIHKFLNYGIFIREITLPYEDPNFKIVIDLDGDKFRANKIILGKKHNLNDIGTIEKFKLEKFCIDDVCRNGLVNVLDWLKQNKHEIKYTDTAFICASRHGHINVLDWFKNNGYQPKHTFCEIGSAIKYAIDAASENGHINVLDWFKKNGYKIKYTYNAIDWASKNGHIDVLDWFKNNEYEIKCTHYGITFASENGHVNVLDWFKNNKYEIKYSPNAIRLASENGHIKVLDWFKNNEYEVMYSERVICDALKNGHVNVSDWFKKHEYEIKFKVILQV